MREKEFWREERAFIVSKYGKATLTVKEIADYTGWDVKTVRSRYFNDFDKKGRWTLSASVLARDLC